MYILYSHHTMHSAVLQVMYKPFLEALEEARAQSKLVHSVLLWGSLDDQSC